MDNERNNAGLPTLTGIDSQKFKASIHMKGEHASTLIYACSLIDYYSIDERLVGFIIIKVCSYISYMGKCEVNYLTRIRGI